MADMTPNDVLDRAADVILERGWTQGSYENDAGEVCVLAALDYACQQTFAATPSDYRRVYWALVDRVGPAVSLWNDEEGRTRDDVLRLLKSTRVEPADEG